MPASRSARSAARATATKPAGASPAIRNHSVSVTRMRSTGAGAAAGSGVGTATGVYDPAMPTCEKLFGYYCTDEFKATEGALAGKLCENFHGNVLGQFRALPEDARRGQEKYCRDNYDVMMGAAKERVRQWKAGLGPGQNGVPPPASPPAP